MRAAFAGLDRDGGGYVLEGELRGLLSSLGDALSSTEVCLSILFHKNLLGGWWVLLFYLLTQTAKQLDQAMRAANVSAGGEVFYDDFVTNLCK